MSHTQSFFAEVQKIAATLDYSAIEQLGAELARLREREGRLFMLGVGGSAANCAHAVNDFRKLCGIEAYAPTDNVSELTARTNDEGWHTVFSEWLKVSRAKPTDAANLESGGRSAGPVQCSCHGRADELLANCRPPQLPPSLFKSDRLRRHPSGRVGLSKG